MKKEIIILVLILLASTLVLGNVSEGDAELIKHHKDINLDPDSPILADQEPLLSPDENFMEDGGREFL